MPAPQPTYRVSTPIPARTVTSSKCPFAVVVIEHVGVVGEVRLEDIETAIEVVVANGDAHARLLQSVFAQGGAALEPLLPKGAVVLVAKEPARSGVARDVDVGPAVVVVVGGNGSHGIRAAGGCDAGLPADIGERAVTIVAKQLNESGRQAPWTAVHRHALPAAVGVLARLGQFLERGVEIIRDEQIQVTVAIEVHPRAPGRRIAPSPVEDRL